MSALSIEQRHSGGRKFEKRGSKWSAVLTQHVVKFQSFSITEEITPFAAHRLGGK
jgi:hypothetical protein